MHKRVHFYTSLVDDSSVNETVGLGAAASPAGTGYAFGLFHDFQFPWHT